jgi:hypothetical protein
LVIVIVSNMSRLTSAFTLVASNRFPRPNSRYSSATKRPDAPFIDGEPKK